MTIFSHTVSPLPKINAQDIIFDHIVCYMDLDAFFAAVEMRENPNLQGTPLIVGGNPKTLHGVVSTCNYEAREYGIHSGMPVRKAVQLCPEVTIVRASHNLYSKVSQNIMAALKNYSPKVKVASIDEAYLDITEIVKDYKEAEKLAYEIKDEIYALEQLTCSIGIAPNKILAKIASGVNKPNGLTIVRPEEINRFLAPLEITEIPGIGNKTKKAFNNIGIYTCEDLAKKPLPIIYQRFGSYSIKLWKLVNGYNTEKTDEKFVSHERKSISEERTFFEPKVSWDEIWKQIEVSIVKIVNKAKEKRMQFRTITLKIRNRNFETETRSYSLPCYTTDQSVVKKVVQNLLVEYLNSPPENVRLIGVKISNLLKIPNNQRNLSQFFNS
ncbi:MAG: DNA polymerase IV [Candidatus Heimdallarchaeaceae archaeon]